MEGETAVVMTEFALALEAFREESKELFPLLMACVYTNGGTKKLSEVLEDYKCDNTEILKLIEGAEVKKWKNI